jgi:hypothetical protein
VRIPASAVSAVTVVTYLAVWSFFYFSAVEWHMSDTQCIYSYFKISPCDSSSRLAYYKIKLKKYWVGVRSGFQCPFCPFLLRHIRKLWFFNTEKHNIAHGGIVLTELKGIK